MDNELRKSWINWREEAGSNNIAGNGQKNSGNLGLTDEKRPRVRSFMWRPSCQTAPVWDSHTPILLCRLIIIIIISGLCARIWFCCSNTIWAFFFLQIGHSKHTEIFFVGLLFFLRAFWVVTSLLGDNFGQQQTMWPLVHRNQLKIIKMMTSHWKPMKGPWKDLEKSWKYDQALKTLKRPWETTRARKIFWKNMKRP